LFNKYDSDTLKTSSSSSTTTSTTLSTSTSSSNIPQTPSMYNCTNFTADGKEFIHYLMGRTDDNKIFVGKNKPAHVGDFDGTLLKSVECDLIVVANGVCCRKCISFNTRMHKCFNSYKQARNIQSNSVKQCKGFEYNDVEKFITHAGKIPGRDCDYLFDQIDGVFRIREGEYKCSKQFNSSQQTRKQLCDNCQKFTSSILKQKKQYTQKVPIGSKRRYKQKCNN